MLGKIFTVLGPRVLGGALSMLAGWVYVKTKGMVQIDATQVVQVGGTMIGTYAGAHRVLSRWINPGDSAKARLADAEKEAVNTGTAVIPAAPVSTYVAPARRDY